MATSLSIDLSPATAARKSSNGDCDGAKNDTHQHQRRDTTITIQCLSELTPLDMMDMANGIADPTGSCLWLGAFLFMEFFARDLDSASGALQNYWSQVRSTLFPPNCHAVELGAGTGMSGLSLMLMSARGTQTRMVEGNDPRVTHILGPSLLVQTDANDDALELCRINHDANVGEDCGKSDESEGDIYIRKLEWGKGNAAKVFGSHLPTTYDIVFATDVLYDLASLVPLVTTASELLKESGYFILSHVPRASIDDYVDESSSDADDWWQQLESIIINEASKVQLFMETLPSTDDDIIVNVSTETLKLYGNSKMILRPSLLPHIWGASPPLSKKFSWQKMMDVGAAILVFQKQSC